MVLPEDSNVLTSLAKLTIFMFEEEKSYVTASP